jgi:predicted permease
VARDRGEPLVTGRDARPRPPVLGRWLIRLRPLGRRRADIESDLRDLFEQRTASLGARHASWRYLRDALSLWTHRLPDQFVIPAEPRRRAGGHMRQDVVFALRLFRRQPGLFGVAIAGLAIAIGLSAAIFSIVNGAFLHGSGISDDSVFQAKLTVGPWSRTSGNTSPFLGNWAYDDYRDLQASAPSVSVAAAALDIRTLRTPDDQSTTVGGLAVTGNYFALIGAHAARGRALSVADDASGAEPVAVLSYAVWTNLLGSDPTIVGRSVWIGDRVYTVVGVIERGFTGSAGDGHMLPAFWTTLGEQSAASADRDSADRRARSTQLEALTRKPLTTADDIATMATLRAELSKPATAWNPPVNVFVRLGPGVSVAQASAELNARAMALSTHAGHPVDHNVVRLDANNDARAPVLAAIVLGIVALVVLLAAANVTNVLLASAAGRAREIGTRLALGAGRGRVMRQLMTESLLVGAAGGALGFLGAFWSVATIAHWMQLPITFDVVPDYRIAALTAGLTMVIGVAAGLAPARYIRHGDLVSALKTDRIGAPSAIRPGGLRSTLIAGQAAASVALLVIAALFTRSAVQVTTADLGLDAAHLLGVAVVLPSSYDGLRTDAYWKTATTRVRSLPGVTATAFVDPPLYEGSASSIFDGHYVYRLQTSADYFNAVGTNIIRGRAYTDNEVRSDAPVAIISESLARAFWADSNPVGARLTRVWGNDDRPGGPSMGLLRKPAGTVVVGVAADAVFGVRNQEAFAIYQPLHTHSPHLIVRTAGDPHAAADAVRTALSGIDADPGVAVRATAVSDNVARELEMPQSLGLLTVFIASVALGLATIGLFGVTTFVVGQRQQEVGVRLALGASGEDILRLLLRDGMRPVFIGLAAGLVLAFIAGRLVQRALYGISGHDPIAIIAAVVVLLAAAAAAIFIPARRATKIDPARMLREQ